MCCPMVLGTSNRHTVARLAIRHCKALLHGETHMAAISASEAAIANVPVMERIMP